MPIAWIVVASSLAVSLVAIVLIARSDGEEVRMLPKRTWYIAAFVPVLGLVGWLWLGMPQRGPSGKRVAKERQRRGKRQKISSDRQLILDRLNSDMKTRTPRISGGSAGSPGSPGSLSARAARSAASAAERSASSPATASVSED